MSDQAPAPDETAARLRALEWVGKCQRMNKGLGYDDVFATIEAALKSAPPPEALKSQEIGPPGLWTCQTCGFQLTKAFLRASDGAVGVDARTIQDVCPNDGTSMRRVTWQEAAEEASANAVFHMERATKAEDTAAALRASLQPEALTPEEWDMVYAACQFQWLNDSLPEAYDNALHQLGLKLAAMIHRWAA